MLVSTFLDDSFRTATHFSELTKQVRNNGCISWLPAPEFFAGLALVVGLLAQWIGSFCLLKLVKINAATRALVCWAIAQPVLYGQLSNFEFVAESLSIVGGLLMLRAHLVFDTYPFMQLLGRLLIPAMYVYYAGQFLYEALVLDETSSLANYFEDMSMFVLNTLVFVGESARVAKNEPCNCVAKHKVWIYKALDLTAWRFRVAQIL